mmetsp:Transcript_19548/g.27494  ORF Transcript_19548/g.27494 Transcript_19548/m.27494 type:complete len:545 (+) Transcript_19548:81-1715(+)
MQNVTEESPLMGTEEDEHGDDISFDTQTELSMTHISTASHQSDAFSTGSQIIGEKTDGDSKGSEGGMGDFNVKDDLMTEARKAHLYDEQVLAADQLSARLIDTRGNEDVDHQIIKDELGISTHSIFNFDVSRHSSRSENNYIKSSEILNNGDYGSFDKKMVNETPQNGNGVSMIKPIDQGKQMPPLNDKGVWDTIRKFFAMVCLAIAAVFVILVLFVLGNIVAGPPSQPVGPYKLVEVQEGEDFFTHYNFYDGVDSAGSNGYVNYVSMQTAFDLGIANVTYESPGDVFGQSFSNYYNNTNDEEAFVYMSTAPTEDGPRESIRLEGIRRYNRGLFVIDLHHMPAGCGTWPAFWLTDEGNWPLNGEIDIIEGVNNQTVVKTALHTTQDCSMDDVPLGVKTGFWDTAQGVPKKDGTIDHTLRDADDCFVYDPHQWLNQGCVAISDEKGTIGTPLNKKGGGVFVLEWDPINRFIKSWVFTPHKEVPTNLMESILTAKNSEISDRVTPDPSLWGLPYAYFPIGKDANRFYVFSSWYKTFLIAIHKPLQF